MKINGPLMKINVYLKQQYYFCPCRAQGYCVVFTLRSALPLARARKPNKPTAQNVKGRGVSNAGCARLCRLPEQESPKSSQEGVS